MDPDLDRQIAVEVPRILRVYKSGRVERLVGTDHVPASVDPSTGVASKDLVIDHDTGVSARLFLPNLSGSLSPEKKLPVLVYYHGGGFCWHSPFSFMWTNYLNSIVAKANVVAVSVGYRLAPEHPVPAAYTDSFAALKWVASHANDGAGGVEPWLKQYGEFDRVYLAGDSVGGTIAHHVAMLGRAVKDEVRIRGIALIHPHFWGKKTFASETEEYIKNTEALWRVACPSTTGLDDPLINPMAPGAPSLEQLACERVLVAVAEKDEMAPRVREYYEGLKESGWPGEAELFETEGEGHAFHRLDPSSEKASALMERVAAFLNQD